MKNIENFTLYIDIDDVIAFSSPLIQKQVNEKTIFKTRILQVIEQLRRNCTYYLDEIKNECVKAFSEKRLPDSERFPKMLLNNSKYENNFSFDKLSTDEQEEIYYNPIRSAMYYCTVVETIFEEFLEERDMFLEGDNLPKGEFKEYNYEKEAERIEVFKKIICNNRNALNIINAFCLKEIKDISQTAKEIGERPNYRNLVRMDANDIIRTNDTNEDAYYLLYEKPIQDVKSCNDCDLFQYVLDNFQVVKNPSRQLIDYSDIYRLENVDWEAVEAIRKAITNLGINEVYSLTHHNGDREYNAKCNLIAQLFPGVDVIGLRFHGSEHNMYRRTRNSKFEGSIGSTNNDPEMRILLDDSKDNYNDWANHGASPVLIRRMTDAEKINGLEKNGLDRLVSYNDLEKVLSAVMNKAISRRNERLNRKILVKE